MNISGGFIKDRLSETIAYETIINKEKQ